MDSEEKSLLPPINDPRPSDSSISSPSLTEAEIHLTDSALTEDQALAQLQRQDLPAEAIEQLSKNASVMKSRKLRIAIASHSRTPRRISLRLIREFYSFDLMRFALQPTVPGDLKHAADEMLINRLASVTLGERISLARRGSAAVVAALLVDKESGVWQTALENSRLTEAAIVRALRHSNATAAFVEAVSHHSKWSFRHEIRMALLRNEKTPLACAIDFARSLPPAQLRDVLQASRLPEKIKTYLRKELATKK